MSFWKRMLGLISLRKGSNTLAPAKTNATASDQHLDLARESLRELIDDARVPVDVRAALHEDYRQIEAMLAKLEQGHIHIAVLGRVGVGKSALLNALLGSAQFTSSPLHGETKQVDMAGWRAIDTQGVFLIDTPGINEVDGEARERLAHEVAARSDLVLFVLDADISATELDALKKVTEKNRPVLVILNKMDHYTEHDRRLLLASIRKHTQGLVPADQILEASAEPRPQRVVHMDALGGEVEKTRERKPEITELRQKLWDVIEAEGKTLAALNAGLFAGELSDRVAERILAARSLLGERLVRTYCVAKGVAVALNPIPVADLFAAAVIDISMVVHMSRLYNLPLSRREAGALVQVIATQMLALMGTVWAVHMVASALKAGTGGLSTVITAGAQGAVAYYATYVVGQAAKQYLAKGKSWGSGGPKHTVREILRNLDRESIMRQAREDILARLRSG